MLIMVVVLSPYHLQQLQLCIYSIFARILDPYASAATGKEPLVQRSSPREEMLMLKAAKCFSGLPPERSERSRRPAGRRRSR